MTVLYWKGLVSVAEEQQLPNVKPKMKKWSERTREQKLRIVIAAVLLLVFIAVTIFATRWVLSLRNPDKLAWFEEVVSSLGIGGWFLLLGIQFVQIVIAFIPGGPIQVIAGALFGPWGGTALCFLGTILATTAVFLIVNRFGRSAVRLFVDDGDLTKYKFLQDSHKLELLVLILFFIPGTPKDALTYLFALTPIKPHRFLLISTVARLPAVITSVLAGDSIMNGDWMRAVIIFIVIGGISIAGLLLHRKLMKVVAKRKETR